MEKKIYERMYMVKDRIDDQMIEMKEMKEKIDNRMDEMN